MFLTWTDDFSVGYNILDVQHKELLWRYNELMKACDERLCPNLLREYFESLAGYIASHIEEEEYLMESHNFPSHELHTMQHKEFMCNLLELSKGLQEIAPSAEVVAAINRTFLEWLLNHVKQEDAKLGRFLTAQPKGEKTSSFC